MPFIPYGRQDISPEDIQAVTDVLQSDWLTQGPAVELFEREVARYCGAKYAVAVNSATSALHIACLAADLGEGDTLWTTPNTFVASANCGLYCGASVDFADIDEKTLNISVSDLAGKLECAERDGTLPKVVIPVHFSGQSCDMEEIEALSGRYGFTVVEDASHAIGGSYRGHRIGSCRYSAMTVFSFHPVKIVTTGEGGVVVTNSEELYERLIRFRSHGITRDPRFLSREPDGPWYYEQLELGFNYRMTDIQAALGTSQMKRLDPFVARRHEIADRYDELLAGLPVKVPVRLEDRYSALHLYVIRLKLDENSHTRREVFDALRSAGIGVNVHYIPVHTQPYYRSLGFLPGDFPRAEKYYEEALTLPLYPGLTFQDQERVVDSLVNSLG